MLRAAWLSSVSFLLACATAPPQPTTKPTVPATSPTAATPTAPTQPPAAPEAPLTPDSVAARVDNDQITVREVDQRITPEEKATIAQAQKDPEVAAWFLAFARARAVEELIDTRLLMRAAEREFVVVTDDMVDQALLEIEKQNSLTRAQLEKALADQGYTLATYRVDLRN